MKLTTLFTKESDLCAAFITAITDDWTAYPETAGWDILLAHRVWDEITAEPEKWQRVA